MRQGFSRLNELYRRLHESSGTILVYSQMANNRAPVDEPGGEDCCESRWVGFGVERYRSQGDIASRHAFAIKIKIVTCFADITVFGILDCMPIS